MVTLPDIQSAVRWTRGSIYLSPCARSENFSQSTANHVYRKLDNLQRTGAFKERGALNRLLLLTAEESARGVIAASAVWPDAGQLSQTCHPERPGAPAKGSRGIWSFLCGDGHPRPPLTLAFMPVR